MTPALTLAPWELPPDCDAPLTAPADFVFRAPWPLETQLRLTTIWARAIASSHQTLHFYFCDGESPHNGNWLLLLTAEEYDFFVSSNFEELFSNDDATWSPTIVRRIYFDGAPYGAPGWHTFEISDNGVCSLDAPFQLEPDIQPSAAVEWPYIVSLLESASATKERLFEALDNSESKLRFILSWLNLTPAEQQEKALCFEQGTLSQMQALMKAVLQSQSDLWHSNNGYPLRWETREWQPNSYFPNPTQSIPLHRFGAPKTVRAQLPASPL